MSKKHIGIYYVSTGGGHRTAARAIAAAISELVSSGQVGSDPEVFVEDIFKDTHPIVKLLVYIYNWLLHNHPTKMKYYSWFIDILRPNKLDISYVLGKRKMFKLLGKCDPQVIVSVHPMINGVLGRAIREKWNGSKLVVVLTDPNADLWAGWASSHADLTIAPNDLAAKALIKLGVDSKKIITIGMPVNPAFVKPPSVTRDDFLSKLGLVPDKLTIVMNPDGAGCNRLIEVYRTLAKASKPVQCILLAGHNRKLLRKLKKEIKTSSVPAAVLPFLDDMADLMAVCDLMVTKAGGLTIYEALARRLPIVIDLLTEPMPQELGTAHLLIREHLAWTLYKPEDILSIVQASEPGQRLKLPPEHQLDHVSAVYDIGRTIVDMCEQCSPEPLQVH